MSTVPSPSQSGSRSAISAAGPSASATAVPSVEEVALLLLAADGAKSPSPSAPSPPSSRGTGASAVSSPNSSRTASSAVRSRNGFSSSICSTSWLSSSVESWSSLIDCCSCGVSARCCETRRDNPCFMRRRLPPRQHAARHASSLPGAGRPLRAAVHTSPREGAPRAWRSRLPLTLAT